METEKNTKSDKTQSYILIGVSLIILGVIFASFAFMQPKVGDKSVVTSAPFSQSETVLTSNVSKKEVNTKSEVIVVEENNNQNTTKKQSEQELNVNYPLNLNTCTSEELQTIKHIGKNKADAIIAYREYLGKYSSVEQLKEISGIGDATFENIKPYVIVK